MESQNNCGSNSIFIIGLAETIIRHGGEIIVHLLMRILHLEFDFLFIEFSFLKTDASLTFIYDV